MQLELSLPCQCMRHALHINMTLCNHIVRISNYLDLGTNQRYEQDNNQTLRLKKLCEKPGTRNRKRHRIFFKRKLVNANGWWEKPNSVKLQISSSSMSKIINNVTKP